MSNNFAVVKSRLFEMHSRHDRGETTRDEFIREVEAIGIPLPESFYHTVRNPYISVPFPILIKSICSPLVDQSHGLPAGSVNPDVLAARPGKTIQIERREPNMDVTKWATQQEPGRSAGKKRFVEIEQQKTYGVSNKLFRDVEEIHPRPMTAENVRENMKIVISDFCDDRLNFQQFADRMGSIGRPLSDNEYEYIKKQIKMGKKSFKDIFLALNYTSRAPLRQYVFADNLYIFVFLCRFNIS